MLEKLKALIGGDAGAKRNDPPKAASAPEAAPPAPAAQPDDGGDALLAGELRAARKIQMGLVPKTFPPIPGCLPFDLYAILEPAREIGGDFYDFWLSGRERLTLVIGDVSGKGIPAALFMAVCRTYLRAFSRSVREPAKLLEYLNNELSRHNDGCMFVTLVCAMVHIPTGQVEYANAGHPPPFLRMRDGNVSVLDSSENTPVGFLRGARYATKYLKLEPGDSLLFYTDGMSEAFDADGEMMGREKSLDLFANVSGAGCRAAVGQLRAEIAEFSDGAEQSDDITLMMYGQLEQSEAFDLSSGFDDEGRLEGESEVFSLSNLDDALPRPTAAPGDETQIQSLSGLAGGG